MIIVELSGGLGNQLFQYAFARFLAHKLNLELKIDVTQYAKTTKSHHVHYLLDKFNIPEHLATPDEIASINEQTWSMLTKSLHQMNLKENILIRNNWMHNEKFFIEIEDLIRREFTLENPLEKNSAAWKEKILSANCAVSLHVRLGDYLRPGNRNKFWGRLVPFDYFSTCVEAIKSIAPEITLFVFSDELQWCKENLKLDVPTEFVEGCEHDYEELYLMSCCKHNIIQHSTFAWWGAWLNQNPNKMVFMPDSFDGSMKNSLVVPFDDNKRKLVELSPMLSIIVYVENNLDTIDTSLQSIFSQNYYDYEVILVDTSSDGSAEICRKFASNRNVTLLTVSRFTTKFMAWNQGLDIAQGNHVLFLTAKDFLLSDTIEALMDACDKIMERDAINRENYITCDTYENYLPNLICTTHYIEENKVGKECLNIIPHKKFSIITDETFQALNKLTEPDFSSTEKLVLLATDSINSLVGTKFFKRQFLNDNNIRYKKGGGADAELAFVVDAFLATEKIAFVPYLCYGRLK